MPGGIILLGYLTLCRLSSKSFLREKAGYLEP